ncbi:MAG: DNA-protecting protein DprA, partial [Desulfobacula sp.]|nr:DNA-protecting protein DprA [Desulfobacula sp.]
ARLVENEMDIIDELHHFIHEKKENYRHVPLQSSQEKKSTHYKNSNLNKYKIYPFLEPYPVHIDVLIEKAGMECSQVTSQLLDLELEGKVTRHQGNYYSISEEHH